MILYIMLSGEPPFSGNSINEVLKEIQRGSISLPSTVQYSLNINKGYQWKHVSSNAVDLIRKLLNHDPNKRITAGEALMDPWILQYSEKKNLETPEVIKCLENMKSFKIYSSIQRAVLLYMAGHVQSREDERKLREIFTMIDTNGDGQISQEELLSGFKILSKNNVEEAAKMVQNTFKDLDINKNGVIDYNGSLSSFNNLK